MAAIIQADLVLSSAAIFTGNDTEPLTGSVAIKDNKILAVGSTEEVETFIGEETKILDVGDRLVMPGFHDSHIHLFLGSLARESADLSGTKSEEEAAQIVKEFADEHPDAPWIFGFRWYHIFWEEQKLPTRHSLDRLIPDRPVLLMNEECHGAWVNTKALDLMGIDEHTPDPPFGKIVRDEHGEPTGFLYETAMKFAEKAFAAIPMDDQKRLFESFLSHARALGVTSVNDMLPLPGFNLGNLDLYAAYDEAGKLTTRIHFLAALDGDLELPKKLRETYKSEKLQFSGLKQFVDGVPIAYTAYLIEPYSDDPSTIGDTLIPKDLLKQWIITADEAGFRIRLHTCGDGAVRLALDCFEEAQRLNGKRDSRHTIEHIEVIHPDDINRLEKLGVIASFQPEHLAAERFVDHMYRKRLGDREPFLWRILTIADTGATVIFGSDFPVVGLDPMTEIYRAVTRLHDDLQPVGGWNPQEKVALHDALTYYTKTPAYNTFREHELGTLEAGKLADIVVLDRNLFAVPAEEIKHAKVMLTIMDGKIVHEALAENRVGSTEGQ